MHLFHKWRPVKAWNRVNGYQCKTCGERKLKFDRGFVTSWLNIGSRQQAYDWLNDTQNASGKKEGENDG